VWKNSAATLTAISDNQAEHLIFLCNPPFVIPTFSFNRLNTTTSPVRGETLETAHLHKLCLKGRTSSAEHDEDFSQIKAFITSQKILGLHDFQEP
jgi:hypothetical protein